MSGPIFGVDIDRPEDVSDRRHRQFMNEALKTAATNHLLTYGPAHFLGNAKTRPGGEYDYERRTAKHQRRKARNVGHQHPNVYLGRESAHVLSSARVTSTHSRARIVYRALHSRGRVQSERWIKEMEVIADDEAAVATEVAGDLYAMRLEEFRNTRVRRRIS